MNSPPSQTFQRSHAGRSEVRGRGHAKNVAVRVRFRGAALCGADVRGIDVNVASATSPDEASLRDSQYSFSSSTAFRSRISLMCAKHYDVGVAESIFSERLKKDLICKRDTFSYTLNDMRLRF